MYLNTARVPWVSLAEEADDTFQTVFTYDDWPTNNVINNLRGNAELLDANGYYVMMWGTAAADSVSEYKLWGRARMNGPMLLLLTGVATLGTQLATTHPITGATIANGLFVDSLTVTGGIFEDLVDVVDFGNNRICLLKFDGTIIHDIAIEFDHSVPAGTDMTLAYAAITGF